MAQGGLASRDLAKVGSHAHVHRPLDVLPQADLDHEVQHSRQLIADRIGTEPASFCCPNGYSSHRVRRAVSTRATRMPVSSNAALANPDGPRFAVPRVQVTPAYDESGILRLVSYGETGWTPRLKRVAYPAWYSAVHCISRHGEDADLTIWRRRYQLLYPTSIISSRELFDPLTEFRWIVQRPGMLTGTLSTSVSPSPSAFTKIGELE